MFSCDIDRALIILHELEQLYHPVRKRGPGFRLADLHCMAGEQYPSPGMELYEKYQYPASGKYEYPDSAYGIMSWWDYGHLIEVVGHRIPNANPFQQGIGSVTQNRPGSSPFFLAENESQAEKVLAELDQNRSRYMNTKYVMVDQQMATGKFHAMAAWSGISNSNYVGTFLQEQGRAVYEILVLSRALLQVHDCTNVLFDGTETDGSWVGNRLTKVCPSTRDSPSPRRGPHDRQPD